LLYFQKCDKRLPFAERPRKNIDHRSKRLKKIFGQLLVDGFSRFQTNHRQAAALGRLPFFSENRP
jgi:hypothetical protein